VTFIHTETGPKGLLDGKRAILVATRGGMHKEGASDHVVPLFKYGTRLYGDL
jgi:FMN-dependent NADH-azoreductase